MKAIILSGGVGKRLWPLGRERKPKQFHALVGDTTLLQQTYRRLRHSFAPADVYLSTSALYVPQIRRELPSLPRSQYIIEPFRRDTAAAMGYAALQLAKKFPHEPCVFVPSDHYIDNDTAFCKTLRVGERLIRSQRVMVDIGVPPTWPNTALGYTRIGERVGAVQGVSVYAFKGHTEKPKKAVASRYVNSGAYLWHVNYYMWTPQFFLDALERYAPDIRKKLASASAYKTIKPISFDYAVTEKMNPSQVRILRAPFRWSDVGSWSEVWSEHPGKNTEGNWYEGDVIGIGSRNNLVLGSKRLVALVGVEDLAVVDTGDALLICKQNASQQVKNVVDELTRRKRAELL